MQRYTQNNAQNRTGLDWAELGWTGLDRVGLGWTGLDFWPLAHLMGEL